MNERRIVIAGGGAAGFFAAITCAEAAPGSSITLLEKGRHWLSKVRISGGGRCNVTHACFDPRELSRYFPRGGAELLGPFQKFQPQDTVEWFESRGVMLKTEPDGRMFPVSDSSQSIIDCLLQAAARAGVELISNCPLLKATPRHGGFELILGNGQTLWCERLMLATGGCRGPAAGQLAESLGHTLEPPVPSLFTFHIAEEWLRGLAGISVPAGEVSVPELNLRERGALLITHAGLSGPAILRLSAWGARPLHRCNYQFRLRVNWLADRSQDGLKGEVESRRRAQAAKLLVNAAIAPAPSRLWENLVLSSGIAREIRWAELSGTARHRLIQQLTQTEFEVTGKTLNQEEFVTCGGVRLREVNFKTMESRLCPGLYFGGELLDIDAVTGGFNFQSAWTTGWLAGKAMAASS